MKEEQHISDIDFTIDNNNLYREESITDLKIGSIRRLIPIRVDGSADDSRPEIFIGNTQLMSPEGPLPIQAFLEVKTLEEAITAFPAAMKRALSEMIEELREMQKKQQQQQRQGRDDSRIIIPGR